MNILNIIFIFCFIILSIGVLVSSFFIYVFFSHSKEKNFKGFKLTIANIIASIFISFIGVMIVPFDILSDYQSDSPSTMGLHFNMDFIWKITMILSVSFYLINIFWLAFYRYSNPFNNDKEDMEYKNRIFAGLKSMMFVVCVSLCILIPGSLFYGGKIRISYKVQTVTPDQLLFAQNKTPTKISNLIELFTFKYRPSKSIAFAAPMIAYGSFLFFIVGAIGMAALPMSLIGIWLKRPKEPKPDEMVVSKIILKEDTLEVIEKLQSLIKNKKEIEKMLISEDADRQVINAKKENYEKGILECQERLIKHEYMRTTNQRRHQIETENPLKYFSALIFGVLGGVMSLAVVIQTVLIPFNEFIVLESLFNYLKKTNLILAIAMYIFISIYLNFCILKGFEVLSFLMPGYLGYNQIKTNKTWLDTWIIITNILIPGSWAVMIYFLKATPDFLSFLRGGQIMNNFVTKIEYFRPFYKYYIFNVLMVIFFIVGIALYFSIGSRKEYLDEKIAEIKQTLKNNQLEYQKRENSIR